jgi:polyhydroxyalkanoate synthase subunit PhaC
MLGLELDAITVSAFALADDLRRTQGEVLGLLGLGPSECSYHIVASTPQWRLRAYGDGSEGPALLIVSAPIKRPYVWDIAPSVSVVRFCLSRRFRVFLLEWTPPGPASDGMGLDGYVDAIGESVARLAAGGSGTARPFLMGHSLGGTLAAMAAALQPDRLQGLILLSSPLCFRRGTSRFGDALAAIVPSEISRLKAVPGALLSQLSVMASPETFLWSRLVDAALSATDVEAADIHGRVERWTLDEVALSGRLVAQVERWLYQEDRFCRGMLTVCDRVLGPSALRLPVLGVVNTSDEIVPPQSMAHFLDSVPGKNTRLIAYPGETGVCFQHLALLVGRQAQRLVWPEIAAWM